MDNIIIIKYIFHVLNLHLILKLILYIFLIYHNLTNTL